MYFCKSEQIPFGRVALKEQGTKMNSHKYEYYFFLDALIYINPFYLVLKY